MQKYPVSRFLFAKLSSNLKSSEISTLIQMALSENPRVKISSPNYFLYFSQEEGLFFGRKVIGYPKDLPKELFYKDFGDEEYFTSRVQKFDFKEFTFKAMNELIGVQEQKFDQKIQKVILDIDTTSLEKTYRLDIFVE